MTASELVRWLEARGVAFWVIGAHLHTHDPNGAISPGLASAIGDNKAEVVALISCRPVCRFPRHTGHTWVNPAGVTTCAICHPPPPPGP